MPAHASMPNRQASASVIRSPAPKNALHVGETLPPTVAISMIEPLE
jgi:hypothetical protein